jgi:hypothetical protein
MADIEAYFCTVCQIAGTAEKALLGICWGAITSKRRRDCPLPKPLPPALLQPHREPIPASRGNDAS